MKFTRAILTAALSAAVLAPMPAMAIPAAQGAKLPSPTQNVEQVRYGYGNRHGGYGYGGGYGRGYGRHRGIGGGAIIGGIVAGALIAGAIRESRASGGDIERCEQTYRSFDASSGTYTGYDGERHICPYLN